MTEEINQQPEDNQPAETEAATGEAQAEVAEEKHRAKRLLLQQIGLMLETRPRLPKRLLRKAPMPHQQALSEKFKSDLDDNRVKAISRVERSRMSVEKLLPMQSSYPTKAPCRSLRFEINCLRI